MRLYHGSMISEADLKKLRTRVVRNYINHKGPVNEAKFCKAYRITPEQLKAFLAISGQGIEQELITMKEEEPIDFDISSHEKTIKKYAEECTRILEVNMTGEKMSVEEIYFRNPEVEYKKYLLLQEIVALESRTSTLNLLEALEAEIEKARQISR